MLRHQNRVTLRKALNRLFAPLSPSVRAAAVDACMIYHQAVAWRTDARVLDEIQSDRTHRIKTRRLLKTIRSEVKVLDRKLRVALRDSPRALRSKLYDLPRRQRLISLPPKSRTPALVALHNACMTAETELEKIIEHISREVRHRADRPMSIKQLKYADLFYEQDVVQGYLVRLFNNSGIPRAKMHEVVADAMRELDGGSRDPNAVRIAAQRFEHSSRFADHRAALAP